METSLQLPRTGQRVNSKVERDTAPAWLGAGAPVRNGIHCMEPGNPGVLRMGSSETPAHLSELHWAMLRGSGVGGWGTHSQGPSLHPRPQLCSPPVPNSTSMVGNRTESARRLEIRVPSVALLRLGSVTLGWPLSFSGLQCPHLRPSEEGV